MASSRKNKTLFIDQEAVSALTLMSNNILYPATSLMNLAEVEDVIKTGLIDNKSFPFPFILAPSGKRNQMVLETITNGEEVTLLSSNGEFATLIVDETFKITPSQRVKNIYGTDDLNHPGVKSTLRRLGTISVSGKYKLLNNSKDINKQKIIDAKKRINAKHISSLFLAGNPLHRGHERLIRQTLETTDLLVVFLLKPNDYEELNKTINYKTREKALRFFVDNFLPKNKVVIIPLDNSYIFGGYNEIILDAIVAKNYGCNRLSIGANHAGLSMFYDDNLNKSIIDKIIGIDIDIDIVSEYVYCDECTTLVSKNTCPHGQHHQISYHADSILELFNLGILPPAVLVRKEISAIILADIFPNRFKNLEKLYYDILPVEGILQRHSEKDFYLELMKLYQTTSLT